MTLLNLRSIDRHKLHRGELVGVQAYLAKAIRAAADREHGRDLALEMTFEQQVSLLLHDTDGVYIVRVSNINDAGLSITHRGVFDTLCYHVVTHLEKKGTVLRSPETALELAEWYNPDDMINLSKRDDTVHMFVPANSDAVKTFVFLEP